MSLPDGAKKLAKIVEYILGRRPDEFGLVPDDAGWVKIKDLLKVLAQEPGWKYVRRSHLKEIQMIWDNPPFEISDNLIRAVNRDRLSGVRPAPDPPKLLYTAIRSRAYPVVREKGIRSGGDQRILLSSDKSMAEKLGRRIDTHAVILTVHVTRALEQGVVFDQAGEGLFLTDFISTEAFNGPPLKEKAKPERTKAAAPEKPVPRGEMAGSFLLEFDSSTKEPKRGRRKEKDADWKRERRRQKKRQKNIDMDW